MRIVFKDIDTILHIKFEKYIIFMIELTKNQKVLLMYEIATLEEKHFRIFQGVYNDFCTRARVDYKFEIEPLNYDDFIDSYKKKLINCLILLEDSIPTAFLVYTTVPQDVIELYVIHCIGYEDILSKRKELLTKFLDTTKNLRKSRIVSYAMLGVQEQFRTQALDFGFELIDTGVMVFDLNNKEKIKELSEYNIYNLPIGYKLTPYREIYFDDLAQLILTSFEKSSDLKFDPRFASLDGCIDITQKITSSIYGRFLPQASKMLLYENKLVGFCLVNLTGEGIANLPLVGILEEHRGQKLSEALVKTAVLDIVKLYQGGIIELNELNVSLDIGLKSAYKMYESAGFVQSYVYPQAYLTKE